MRTSNKGLVELVGHEGVCLSKYKDSVGVWTIGIGATVSEIADLSAWPLSKTITMQEAFELFRRSIVKYENALNKGLTRPIEQWQFDALVSWCYNVGTGWVRKASVISLINEGADPQRLRTALMMFKKPSEIIGRRTKEARLLSTGKYSNDGKALLFSVSSKGYPMYSTGKTINVWEHIEHSSETPLEPVTVPKKEETRLSTPPSLLKQALSWISTSIEALQKTKGT